eukprot:CAMPEP_0185013890 /NCGR_PEP_ID=MMETSP1098-20130426/99036_1 /TAXON_ID=89044 /ORGANISM="Spumella elongata, Strain CCAP 955/1" /LENGTH=503 /DNA_ID=CAMNT_0027542963 /DNA_START=406 /DNA_END=1917 /DNA_ORIENTATION=-
MTDRAVLLGGASIIAGALLLNSLQSSNESEVPQKIVATSTDPIKEPQESIQYPEEIRHEIHSRVKTFFSEDGFQKLQDSFVVVVGLGGVGSHCANMLVRSGVGKVRLVDFDQVTLSSLNRHAVCTMSDVGISKAEAMRRKLKEIVPWCEVEAITEMFRIEEAPRLLEGSPTMVVDCIDDVVTKAELIAYCKQNNLPILTSMGAGGKSDPTKLRISPLSDCINDPLAQKIRWKLKKHGVAAEDVMSVFSVEKPVCELLPLDEEQRLAPQDYGAVDYLRLRVIPVLGTSPSIFGQALASYVLCMIGNKLYEADSGERMSKNLKHKVRQVLKKDETKRFGTEREINLDDEDIEFITQMVWRSRCASTNRRFGGHVILTLTRWDASQPPTPYNLVLLMQNEAQKLHDQGKSAFSAEVVERIEERLRWAKKTCEESWETLDHTGGSQKVPIAVKQVPKGLSAGPSAVTAASGEEKSAKKGSTHSPWLTVAGATLVFLLGYGACRAVNK